jgi:hypothetical protein
MNRDPKKFTQKSAELFPGAFPYKDSESPLDDQGGYGDPHANGDDGRPDFVKADDEGWTRLPSANDPSVRPGSDQPLREPESLLPLSGPSGSQSSPAA